MRKLCEILLICVTTITICSTVCFCQTKIVNVGAKNTTEPRLGLLATQLGLSPVPGYDSGGQAGPAPINIPPQDYLPTGGAPPPPPPATGYEVQSEGGIHGGNLVSPNQCQCVPIEQCPSYNNGGNVPPNIGNGQQEGQIPPYAVEGHQGSNVPPYSGDSGQHGENVPISGGSGLYGLGADQGGQIPVIGGSNSGDGLHGGNLPVQDNQGDQGYGGDSVSAPNTDGAGLLDLRIVNRPPKPGGVQCLNNNVFCCDFGQSSSPVIEKPEYPINNGQVESGGFGTCGSRNFIQVPGRSLDYGEAQFGAYPWMAVVLGKSNNYVGAGALISPNYVLTAAHKIKSWQPGSAMKVRFGEWNAKEDSEPYKNVEIAIDNVLIHPGFNPANLQNDIALVRLAEPVDTKSYPHIRAVCLPQQGYQYTGQRCWTAGFGKDAFEGGKHSYILREVDLPIMDSNECEKRLRSTRLGKYFELNRHSFLCAGGEEGKDACTGDGGAPLVCEAGKGGMWTVAGLVAFGVGCGDYGIPGGYVNVPNYVNWINEQIYKY